MRFEYDEHKSRINKEKHGIDFVEAQKLWQNENALVIPANIVDDEVRYALPTSSLSNPEYPIYGTFSKNGGTTFC